MHDHGPSHTCAGSGFDDALLDPGNVILLVGHDGGSCTRSLMINSLMINACQKRAGQIYANFREDAVWNAIERIREVFRTAYGTRRRLFSKNRSAAGHGRHAKPHECLARERPRTELSRSLPAWMRSSRGAMLQIQAKRDCRTSREENDSWLCTVLHQERSPASAEGNRTRELFAGSVGGETDDGTVSASPA
jgi:hypothetical protein